MTTLNIFIFFFFSSRRRHTRLTCDWSSDVCSSDLSAPVLGPEARRVFGTEGSCNPNSASDQAGLLYSKRVLLGRSDFVSGGRALEGCSGSCVLERSGSSNCSQP